MPRWMRVVMIGVLLWLAVTLVWATHSWTATVPLKTPDKAPTQEAKFRCGAPLSGDTASSLISPSSTAYAVSGSPCDQRTARRNLVYTDIAVAGVILVVLVRIRSQHHEKAA